MLQYPHIMIENTGFIFIFLLELRTLWPLELLWSKGVVLSKF